MVERGGKVAIQYYETMPKLITVRKKQYAFVVQHNVCMAWVDAEDVADILAITGGCCGKKNPGVYRYANELAVKIFETGDR